MEATRTVPVKLRISDSAEESLHQTIEQFQWAANYVVDNAENDDGYIITSKQNLHERTYDTVREHTDLHANLVQAARSRAADALKGVIERWKAGRYASLPTFTAEFLDYDKRSATFHDNHASLSTVDGRIRAEYILPHEDASTPHSEHLNDNEVSGASLHYRDDDWYLHLRVKTDVEDPDPTTKHPTVLGVDLNVTGSIAVTSTGAFIGNADALTHKRNQYERKRGRLQQTGTQSAHRASSRIGSRFANWSEDLLHGLANEIITEARKHGCTHIAFEDLTHIRERIGNGKQFQQWAFRRLYKYTEYKAEAAGVVVEQGNPAYTSQRCSQCGFTHDDNRDDKTFRCLKCEYELNADYNAAKNVANKFVRRGQTSHGGRATSQLALKSGMVNGNGDYTPASLGA